MVDEWIEGHPVARLVHRGCGVLVAPLGPPAQLFSVRHRVEVEYGHDLGGPGTVSVGNRAKCPGACRGIRGENRVRTQAESAAAVRALDLFEGARTEIARAQQTDDRPFWPAFGQAGRSSGRSGRCAQSVLPVESQPTAEFADLLRAGGGFAGRTDEAVRDAAPLAAVPRGVGHSGTEVPTAVLRHRTRRDIVRVKVDPITVTAVVPLDRDGAQAAAVEPIATQGLAGAARGDPQRAVAAECRWGAVPSAPGGIGVHGGDRARQHAQDLVLGCVCPANGSIRCNGRAIDRAFVPVGPPVRVMLAGHTGRPRGDQPGGTAGGVWPLHRAPRS